MTGPQPEWVDRYDARAFPSFSYTSDGIVFSGREVQDIRVATVRRDAPDPFAGFRAWPGGFVDWAADADARAAVVRHLDEQTGLPRPSFLEPLDTYDALGRDPRQFAKHGARGVSKAFWALVGPESPHDLHPGGRHGRLPAWNSVYEIVPWEDRRTAEPDEPHRLLDPLLSLAKRHSIAEARIRNGFGAPWNEERTGERIRLLLESGMLAESARDRWGRAPTSWQPPVAEDTGVALAFDHRVMLADALGRLRGKLKYLPETLRVLMPDAFPLSVLYRLVSAVSGRSLDKPNFWRMFTRHKSVQLLDRIDNREREPSGGRAVTRYRFRAGVPRLRLDPSLRFPFHSP